MGNLYIFTNPKFWEKSNKKMGKSIIILQELKLSIRNPQMSSCSPEQGMLCEAENSRLRTSPRTGTGPCLSEAVTIRQ